MTGGTALRPARQADGRERAFDLDELFFSTTDRRGRIRTGNSVFVRVSVFDHDELIGAPHNVIRHPDMPRVVFRLLWDHLEADRPIAAYVKNRAKDGSPYWVLATARPVGDGYLSIRSKPCSPFFDAVKGLYPQLRQIEDAVESDGRGRTAAMDASEEALLAALAGLGFPSYDAFMQEVLAAELHARDNLLGGRSAHVYGMEPNDRRLRSLHTASAGLAEYLDEVFARLDGFRTLYKELTGRSEGLLNLADDVALLSLNAIVASGRLAVRAPTLEVVAAAMRDTCGRIADDVRALFAEIGPAVERLGTVSFAIGLAKLQCEILRYFVAELAADDAHGGAQDHAAASSVALLAGRLIDDVVNVRKDLVSLDELLGRITRRAAELQRTLRRLAAVELNGRVQAARSDSPPAFATLFEQVRSSGDQAKELAAGIEDLLGNQQRTDPKRERASKNALVRFSEGYQELTGRAVKIS